ncbi:MAG TPA: protein kinase, partial [Candidatus Xenobia bacterium]
QRILDVAIQVARGLAYAHSLDFIHQDVKPANVLMTADGTAKLTDFGLGRSWDGTLDEDVLPPGRELLTNIGGMTPAYASPEQVAKQPLTTATDVWSWGLLVLEMFAGEVIWSTGKQASKALSDYDLYGAENADIPPMPEAVSEILQRCFKDKPAERWPSLLDIVKELIALYPDLIGLGYPRLVVEDHVLKAATINNRALAAADLGFEGKMDEMFDEALALNPDSVHAVFNRGLSSLRSGKITFEALVEALEQAKPSPGNGWELGYLKAWLHIERGEEQDARHFLAHAHREAFNDPDGDHAIARAADLARAYNANMSVLTAHGSPAWGVDLTDDNAFAISASDDSTLRVWDVSTGKCIRLLEGHTAAVFSVALTPEGHVAISGSEDMTVRVWNVGMGEAVHILEGHEDSVTGVISSGQGKTGASCSMDGTVRLWDIESGYCSKTLKAESGAPLTALAGGGDLHVVVAAEEGGDIQVWDTQAGHLVKTLKGHEDKVEALAMTREGTLVVSASDDGTLRLWDLRNGHTTHILEGHHGWVNGVALTPDGSLCISAGWDKTLRVWDVSTGRCLYTLTGHENHIRGVALNPDGTQAVSVAIDGAMGFWKLPEELAQAPRTLIRARASGHREVDRDAFVEAVETADTLNQEEQWKAAAESLLRGRSLSGYEFSPVAVALSGLLAHHAGRGRLRGVWTNSIIETRNRTTRGLTLSANGRLAVTANGNRSIQVWDRQTGKLIRDLKGHDGAVQDVALTHDSVTAVSAGVDLTVRVWNLPRSECQETLQGHTGAVWSVACTPDAALIVSGGWDDTVRLWSGGRCLKVMKGHDGPVLAVALSPDAKLVASGSADNTVRI